MYVSHDKVLLQKDLNIMEANWNDFLYQTD